MHPLILLFSPLTAALAGHESESSLLVITKKKLLILVEPFRANIALTYFEGS